MTKKQRTFWLDEKDWKNLQRKIFECGFEGKGKFERFMEKICRETLIFITGEKANLKISVE